jgi:hypothetical protein
MAGFFPDAPDHKVFYNDDGTVVFTQGTGGGVTSPVSNVDALNGETQGTNAASMDGTTRVGFAFPQSMNIVGVFVCTNTGSAGTDSGILRTSTDTTNGSDGAWIAPTTTLGISTLGDPSSGLRWRTHIQAVSCLGIKGLTISTSNTAGSARSIHLYGRPASGTTDRLRFWHPTTDTEVLGPHFDYGDLLQGQTAIVQFRVKNNSTTKTANAVVVADDALSVPSPTLASQTMFSSDGTTYTATLNIGNLAPGALSAVLRARLVLVASARVGPWRQRFKATPGTWT